MKPAHDLQAPTVPVSYLQLLLEVVTERGANAQQLFAGMPFGPDLLQRPTARMSALQWGRLVSQAMRLTGDPGLGYECGLRMRPSAHGFLGYATLSCASMREAMELTIRYAEARQRGFAMRLVTEDGHAAVEVREKQPVTMLRSFFYEHILIGLARGGAAILGREANPFDDVEIWFDWPEPAYHAAYRKRLPRIRFSRRANLMRFPQGMLELRPVLADPQASTQLIEQCERELVQAGGTGDSIGLRVCAVLVQLPHGGYPDLEAIAGRLHMSSRTLSRRLRDDGGSFQQLLDDTRRRDACELIETTQLDLQDIAARLGYRNPANFTRAFRKWTGEAPSRYRQRRGGWQ
ncbi:MAG: AraC family transcriptional regulator [Nevskia sp.]|nr:AraC family transcriptional regulator [Nevskia sp.]